MYFAALGPLLPGANGRFPALRLVVANQADLRVLRRQLSDHVNRVVGRSVIDHHDLKPGGQLGQHFEQAGDLPWHGRFRIVDRYENAQRSVHWRASSFKGLSVVRRAGNRRIHRQSKLASYAARRENLIA